ncbi:hypothetical protein GCM10009527_046500 [Actinomadura nitritigenes]|uniref:Copper-binding protein n=1 Tax=Actinomadura nitritigenes TaxID=134602 RepID=A0ABS3R6E0_9ACTN|nr:hypothetical protein [Actinomadura nitritigenes]MBO2441809.1 hypothetical protein [Actinomadura nitritigenes]
MNKSTISTTLGAAVLAAGALAPAGAAHATTSPSPSAKTTTVTVTEKEFTLTPSMTNLKPGAYTFVAKNVGTTVHGLAISGPGISGTKMITGVKPGSTGMLKAVLKSGTYQMWCPVDNHKGLGMHTQLTVSGAGGGGAPTSPSPTTPAPTTSKPGGY